MGTPRIWLYIHLWYGTFFSKGEGLLACACIVLAIQHSIKHETPESSSDVVSALENLSQTGVISNVLLAKRREDYKQTNMCLNQFK